MNTQKTSKKNALIQAINTYLPNKRNLTRISAKWNTKICVEEKSSSFNQKLYDDYLTVINDPIQQNKIKIYGKSI